MPRTCTGRYDCQLAFYTGEVENCHLHHIVTGNQSAWLLDMALETGRRSLNVCSVILHPGVVFKVIVPPPHVMSILEMVHCTETGDNSLYISLYIPLLGSCQV